ncbi:HpcH/HpaI aldolase/citrate lyase family protein [Cytobacillus purgationiresistens]|uniref:Citrate lyase beta subunit n=1 Tax=Cytobacillus purgationiresistens TaxID=863449 RepID=A0ABU0AL75_9BACI|nr:HpcH/HpaI aldolase/citrate lyase family protein [Cytobacillus purgationiresistens]MDQ0272019.1 citrate lyase beta subunit [Cytobacillus purgationiresistens]
MRLFVDLSNEEKRKLFYKEPESFNKHTSKEVLSYALGATLYMPATRPNIHQDLVTKKHAGLTSIVICLEDSIGDNEVERAEQLLQNELQKLYCDISKGYVSLDDLPLIFIRIRNNEQLLRLRDCLQEEWGLLTGIVIPKFSPDFGKRILEQVSQLNKQGHSLYVMPILETKNIIFKETRMNELILIKSILDDYYDLVLNVRMGATDFCGLYGIRRNTDTTVYDIAVINDCIADILNIFLRSDKAYVVSGPVWEHFASKERMLKPQLRRTPFRERYGEEGVNFRSELINSQMDGFIKEILMDITNGITGKTIIHPTHIKPVQALNTINYEEYLDAKSIIDQAAGEKGVLKSAFSNKMNEIKPHYYWAQRILLKSRIYGVLHEEFTYIDLLQSEIHTGHSQSVEGSYTNN